MEQLGHVLEEPDVERLLHRPSAQPEVCGEELQRAHAVALREHRLQQQGQVLQRARVWLARRRAQRVGDGDLERGELLRWGQG